MGAEKSNKSQMVDARTYVSRRVPSCPVCYSMRLYASQLEAICAQTRAESGIFYIGNSVFICTRINMYIFGHSLPITVPASSPLAALERVAARTGRFHNSPGPVTPLNTLNRSKKGITYDFDAYMRPERPDDAGVGAAWMLGVVNMGKKD